jgi:hypothetical protein
VKASKTCAQAPRAVQQPPPPARPAHTIARTAASAASARVRRRSRSHGRSAACRAQCATAFARTRHTLDCFAQHNTLALAAGCSPLPFIRTPRATPPTRPPTPHGRAQWIDVAEYLSATPDAIATNSPACTLQVGRGCWSCTWWCVQAVHAALAVAAAPGHGLAPRPAALPCEPRLARAVATTHAQVLNETFSTDLREYLSPHFSLDDASFISIDATGADVRVRLGNEFNVERLGFSRRVTNLEEAIGAVKEALRE